MSVFATLKNTASSVAKFMARYADEANNIADIFRTVLPALPINRQDKEKVEDVINDLDKVAERISAFLDENPGVGEPVKVKASDVAKAVADYLEANPAVIGEAVAKALEGNANA